MKVHSYLLPGVLAFASAVFSSEEAVAKKQKIAVSKNKVARRAPFLQPRSINISPGPASPFFILDLASQDTRQAYHAVYDGDIYLRADYPGKGFEVVKIDTQTDTAELMMDVASGPASSSPFGFKVMGDALYFFTKQPTGGDDLLWRSYGTAASTTLVAAVPPVGDEGGPFHVAASLHDSVAVAGNQLFFVAGYPDYLGQFGKEVWVTDGTPQGTSLVRNIGGAGFEPSLGAKPRSLTSYNGAVYFSAKTQSNGRELWQTDGTWDNTIMNPDINWGHLGEGDANPRNMIEFNGLLYFVANNGAFGPEWFRTDGQSPAQLVGDLNPGQEEGVTTFQERNEVVHNGALYFVGSDSSPGYVVAKLASNNEMTVLQPPEEKHNFWLATSFTSYKGEIFFSAEYDPNPTPAPEPPLEKRTELFRVTTADEVKLFGQVNPNGDSRVGDIIRYAGKLFFTATGSENVGSELWIYDGSAPSLFADIAVGDSSSTPLPIGVVNGKLYFYASTPEEGYEVWVVEKAD